MASRSAVRGSGVPSRASRGEARRGEVRCRGVESCDALGRPVVEVCGVVIRRVVEWWSAGGVIGSAVETRNAVERRDAESRRVVAGREATPRRVGAVDCGDVEGCRDAMRREVTSRAGRAPGCAVEGGPEGALTRDVPSCRRGVEWSGVMSRACRTVERGVTGAPGRPFRLTVQTQREGDLLRVCLRYLSVNRIPAWRCNVSAFLAEAEAGRSRRFYRSLPAGHPDIAGVLPPIGRAIYVEAKSVKGKLSPTQVAWHARCGPPGR